MCKFYTFITSFSQSFTSVHLSIICKKENILYATFALPGYVNANNKAVLHFKAMCIQHVQYYISSESLQNSC